MADLHSSDGRRDFEKCITDLLASGAVDSAWARILELLPEYPALSGIIEETPSVDAWDEVAADCLHCNESFARDGHAPATSLTIELWRVEDSATVALERIFHSERLEGHGVSSHEWRPGDWGRFVPVTGMGVVSALWQLCGTLSPDETLLMDCISLVQVHRAIDAALTGRGLPHPLRVSIASFGGGGHEPGRPPSLPQVTRHAPVPAVMDPKIAAQAFERRKVEDSTRFQEIQGTMLAEYRELYRLVRLFPFYRFLGRKKLGDILDHQLQVSCRSQGLPTRGVGWRMSPRAFEALLRTYATKRGVTDVDATLSPDRVDTLHTQWLEAARAGDFILPEPRMTLFATTMTWGLKFGGPLVQERWARLKPFCPEQPTAVDRWSREPTSNTS